MTVTTITFNTLSNKKIQMLTSTRAFLNAFLMRYVSALASAGRHQSAAVSSALVNMVGELATSVSFAL
ncbi:hypothetical protein GCM10011586_29800 [Silvibacterium dinghuense]|nr:hypothetical protein GCM10011586_29800 [Silvibacterium dinghuense]